ncbi:uncharacterized protein LOC100425035 [Macaca mulatta]
MKGQGEGREGRQESQDTGVPAPERPQFPAPLPRNWPGPCPRDGGRLGWEEAEGASLRLLARGRLGGCWLLSAPVAAPRGGSPRLPKPARVPWPPSVSQPAPKTATGQCGAAPAFFEPRREKLTMKMDSLMEEKLECSLWCCVSDPSLRSLAARCCVLERHIVP